MDNMQQSNNRTTNKKQNHQMIAGLQEVDSCCQCNVVDQPVFVNPHELSKLQILFVMYMPANSVHQYQIHEHRQQLPAIINLNIKSPHLCNFKTWRTTHQTMHSRWRSYDAITYSPLLSHLCFHVLLSPCPVLSKETIPAIIRAV